MLLSSVRNKMLEKIIKDIFIYPTIFKHYYIAIYKFTFYNIIARSLSLKDDYTCSLLSHSVTGGKTVMALPFSAAVY
jgi:hypothetical protein